MGIVCYFFLIDSPDSRLLRLSEEEKEIMEERTRDNAVMKHKIIMLHHIREALLEPRWWLLMIATFAVSLQNGGMLTFSSTFTYGLGFDALQTILLQIPSGMASALGVVVAAGLAYKTRQIIYTCLFMLIIGIVGLIILMAIPAGGVKLVGYYLSWGGTGAYSIMVTIIGNNVKGYTKKIFYNGAIMFFYTLGNLVGPLIMIDTQAPRYMGGMTGFLVGYVVAFICMALIRLDMMHANKKRRTAGPPEKVDPHQDLTDKEDSAFIYRL